MKWPGLVVLILLLSGCSASRDVQFDLFLVALGPTDVKGEPIGCGDFLVRVPSGGTLVNTRLESALSALLQAEDTDVLVNRVRRPDLVLESVIVEHDKATVRFEGPFRIGGVCDHPRIEMQLRRTAEQFADSVEFFVGDETLESFLSLKG